MEVKRFSTLSRLLRAMAWITKFANNALGREKNEGLLQTEELNTAEEYWIRIAQSEVNSKELSLLRDGQTLRKESNLLELHLYLDEHSYYALADGCRGCETAWTSGILSYCPVSITLVSWL